MTSVHDEVTQLVRALDVLDRQVGRVADALGGLPVDETGPPVMTGTVEEALQRLASGLAAVAEDSAGAATAVRSHLSEPAGGPR